MTLQRGPPTCVDSGGRRAAVNVLEPNDVVFTQVLAALDLDQDEVHDTRVDEAVLVASRDIRRLVGLQ